MHTDGQFCTDYPDSVLILVGIWPYPISIWINLKFTETSAMIKYLFLFYHKTITLNSKKSKHIYFEDSFSSKQKARQICSET